MEERLMHLPDLSFFYRTKCNGIRVAFESDVNITTPGQYESLCRDAEQNVQPCFPAVNQPDYVELIFDDCGYTGQMYWSYPRAQNPVWLNPERRIE